MDNLKREVRRSLIYKAVIFSIVCALLFLIELMLATQETALQQIPCLVVNAMLFYLLAVGCDAVYLWVMKEGGKRAISFYLLVKVLRLFLAIIVLLIYAFADCRNLLVFSMNIFVLYLVSMITSILFYVKTEQRFKIKKR